MEFIVIAVSAILVAINICATWPVLTDRHSTTGERILFCAVVWLLPFVGAVVVLRAESFGKEFDPKSISAFWTYSFFGSLLQPLLARIARYSRFRDLRLFAIRRLSTQSALHVLALDPDEELRRTAFFNLKDREAFFRYFLECVASRASGLAMKKPETVPWLNLPSSKWTLGTLQDLRQRLTANVIESVYRGYDFRDDGIGDELVLRLRSEVRGRGGNGWSQSWTHYWWLQVHRTAEDQYVWRALEGDSGGVA